MKPLATPQLPQLAFGALALLAVAVAGPFLIERFAPFDQRFEPCSESEAEWKLIVTCSALGSSDVEEYVDYFRTRRKRASARWQLPIENDSATELAAEWQSPRYESHMSIACGFGSEGGAGASDDFRFTATDTAAGVEISIGHQRTKNGQESAVHTAKFTVPFPRKVNGRQGSLEYSAAWQQVN